MTTLSGTPGRPDEQPAAEDPAPVEPRPAEALGRGEQALRGLERIIIAAPDRIVTAFLSAAIPVGLAVTFRVFYPAVVLPAVVIAVLLTWHWTPSRYLRGTGRLSVALATRRGRAVTGAALALVLAAVWVWANRYYASEYVVLTRDPGIYTLRGMWLIHHHSPVIDVHQALQVAAGVPGASVDSLAFPARGSTIYPQSNGLFPGLLGVAGWGFGLRGVLAGNLFIGAMALLAVYGFARRLLGPIWALVPLVALACSLPFIAFTRSPYSEPVSLAATFGGLTLLWTAWEAKRISRFFVAGLLLGVGSLARVDGGATTIGVLAGFVVIALGAREVSRRRLTALAATAFFVGSALMIAVSLIDGAWNSPIYLGDLRSQVVDLNVATLAAWVVAVGVAFVPVQRLRNWAGGNGARLGLWAFWASIVIGLVMVSRPLWWIAHYTPLASAPQIAAEQAADGLPVDGTRSYDESSVTWLGMYLGWATLVLGAIGAALLLARVLRKRDPRIAMFAMTVACVSLLYLNRISIFPDQIWAMRRFLPVIIPGLLIAAGYALLRAFRRRPRLGWVPVALAAVVVGGSVVTWGPELGIANSAGQVKEMDIACNSVDGRPVVVVNQPVGAAWFLPTFVIGCGVPTVSVNQPTPQALARVRAQFGGGEVALVTWNPKDVTWSGATPAPVSTMSFPNWAQPLQKVPRSIDYLTRSTWVGLLQPNGTVAPLH